MKRSVNRSDLRLCAHIMQGDPDITLKTFDGHLIPVYKGLSSQKAIRVKLPSVIPNSDLVALGQFITAWSELEFVLHLNFDKLLGLGFSRAAAISYRASGRQLVDLVKDQLDLYPIGSEAKQEFLNLTKRFGKKNTIRNRIVHGFWNLVVDIRRKGGLPAFVQSHTLDPHHLLRLGTALS